MDRIFSAAFDDEGGPLEAGVHSNKLRCPHGLESRPVGSGTQPGRAFDVNCAVFKF
jgi:hypothetical protein